MELAHSPQQLLTSQHAIDGQLGDLLELCQRQEAPLSLELRKAESERRERTRTVEAIGRPQTIPGAGALTATTIYAWVGDARRFPDTKALAAYAGLVPSVRQSGATRRLRSITNTGSKALRSTRVQAAYILMNRCRGADAMPLQAIGTRVQTSRGRRKIATVVLARGDRADVRALEAPRMTREHDHLPRGKWQRDEQEPR